MHARDMKNVSLQTYGKNRISSKLPWFFRKTQTLQVNNSRFIMIKNAKSLRYDF